MALNIFYEKYGVTDRQIIIVVLGGSWQVTDRYRRGIENSKTNCYQVKTSKKKKIKWVYWDGNWCNIDKSPFGNVIWSDKKWR